jgi:hypothetical protein
MSTVTYTLLVLSLLACYFHGFKHSPGLSIGVDDWTATDLQSFFLKQGKVNIEVTLLQDLGLDGGSLFDSHIIDDAFLASKMNLGRELDRKNILNAIESLDEELTTRPNDLFEWRLSNRRLFRYLSQMGPHAQVLWFRFYDHPGALDEFDKYIDDMPALQFWTVWLFAPNYFHYKLALANDLHNSYMDEFSVWYFGIATTTQVLSVSTLLLTINKAGKGDVLVQIGATLLAMTVMIAGVVWLEVLFFAYAYIVHEYLYWMIPNWIDDLLFMLSIYFTKPLLTLHTANDVLKKFAISAGFMEDGSLQQ